MGYIESPSCGEQLLPMSGTRDSGARDNGPMELVIVTIRGVEERVKDPILSSFQHSDAYGGYWYSNKKQKKGSFGGSHCESKEAKAKRQQCWGCTNSWQMKIISI